MPSLMPLACPWVLLCGGVERFVGSCLSPVAVACLLEVNSQCVSGLGAERHPRGGFSRCRPFRCAWWQEEASLVVGFKSERTFSR